MLSEPAYDEVEPRKTHEGATLPCEVGLPDLYQDIYAENNLDETFVPCFRTGKYHPPTPLTEVWEGFVG
jgi:hypothetical protein